MEVFHSLSDYAAGNFPIATIGTFDGVHPGHRSILSRLTERKKALIDAETVIITFDPHPRKVLIRDAPPPGLLQTLPEKIEKLTELNIDKLLVLPFTEEFSRMESDEFIRSVLAEGIRVKELVIGYDHRFGKNRTGGLPELKEAGDRYGFSVSEIPAYQINDSNVSSTKIRKALIEGNVSGAERLLGYSYALSGTVIIGNRRGKQLGYPTANLSPDHPDKLIPLSGVYAVEVQCDFGKYTGMMNIGYRPTFGDGGLSLEVHILDFENDLYGQSVRIFFRERIRDEQKFTDLNALVAQLQKDEASVRDFFASDRRF